MKITWLAGLAAGVVSWLNGGFSPTQVGMAPQPFSGSDSFTNDIFSGDVPIYETSGLSSSVFDAALVAGVCTFGGPVACAGAVGAAGVGGVQAQSTWQLTSDGSYQDIYGETVNGTTYTCATQGSVYSNSNVKCFKSYSDSSGFFVENIPLSFPNAAANTQQMGGLVRDGDLFIGAITETSSTYNPPLTLWLFRFSISNPSFAEVKNINLGTNVGFPKVAISNSSSNEYNLVFGNGTMLFPMYGTKFQWPSAAGSVPISIMAPVAVNLGTVVSMTTDASNNIYLAGQPPNVFGDVRARVAKYDPNFNQQWNNPLEPSQPSSVPISRVDLLSAVDSLVGCYNYESSAPLHPQCASFNYVTGVANPTIDAFFRSTLTAPFFGKNIAWASAKLVDSNNLICVLGFSDTSSDASNAIHEQCNVYVPGRAARQVLPFYDTAFGSIDYDAFAFVGSKVVASTSFNTNRDVYVFNITNAQVRTGVFRRQDASTFLVGTNPLYAPKTSCTIGAENIHYYVVGPQEVSLANITATMLPSTAGTIFWNGQSGSSVTIQKSFANYSVDFCAYLSPGSTTPAQVQVTVRYVDSTTGQVVSTQSTEDLDLDGVDPGPAFTGGVCPMPLVNNFVAGNSYNFYFNGFAFPVGGFPSDAYDGIGSSQVIFDAIANPPITKGAGQIGTQTQRTIVSFTPTVSDIGVHNITVIAASSVARNGQAPKSAQCVVQATVTGSVPPMLTSSGSATQGQAQISFSAPTPAFATSSALTCVATAPANIGTLVPATTLPPLSYCSLSSQPGAGGTTVIVMTNCASVSANNVLKLQFNLDPRFSGPIAISMSCSTPAGEASTINYGGNIAAILQPAKFSNVPRTTSVAATAGDPVTYRYEIVNGCSASGAGTNVFCDDNDPSFPAARKVFISSVVAAGADWSGNFVQAGGSLGGNSTVLSFTVRYPSNVRSVVFTVGASTGGSNGVSFDVTTVVSADPCASKVGVSDISIFQGLPFSVVFFTGDSRFVSSASAAYSGTKSIVLGSLAAQNSTLALGAGVTLNGATGTVEATVSGTYCSAVTAQKTFTSVVTSYEFVEGVMGVVSLDQRGMPVSVNAPTGWVANKKTNTLEVTPAAAGLGALNLGYDNGESVAINIHVQQGAVLNYAANSAILSMIANNGGWQTVPGVQWITNTPGSQLSITSLNTRSQKQNVLDVRAVTARRGLQASSALSGVQLRYAGAVDFGNITATITSTRLGFPSQNISLSVSLEKDPSVVPTVLIPQIKTATDGSAYIVFDYSKKENCIDLPPASGVGGVFSDAYNRSLSYALDPSEQTAAISVVLKSNQLCVTSLDHNALGSSVVNLYVQYSDSGSIRANARTQVPFGYQICYSIFKCYDSAYDYNTIKWQFPLLVCAAISGLATIFRVLFPLVYNHYKNTHVPYKFVAQNDDGSIKLKFDHYDAHDDFNTKILPAEEVEKLAAILTALKAGTIKAAQLSPLRKKLEAVYKSIPSLFDVGLSGEMLAEQWPKQYAGFFRIRERREQSFWKKFFFGIYNVPIQDVFFDAAGVQAKVEDLKKQVPAIPADTLKDGRGHQRPKVKKLKDSAGVLTRIGVFAANDDDFTDVYCDDEEGSSPKTVPTLKQR